MQITNKRGQYGANIAKQNRAKIKAWFEAEGGTVTECSEDLKISRAAIYRALAVLAVEQSDS